MKSFIPFALLATVAIAPGQVLHPDARDRVTNPPEQKSDDQVIQRQPEEKKKSGGMFGNDLPFFDPSSETVAWNGHNWAATDNRALAARFERYLNEPEDLSEAAREYRETIDAILELVSPHHKGGPDFPAAVKLLPRASSFPGDAKLCDSLTQAIYAAVLAKKDIKATQALNTAIEGEKQRVMREADWKARKEHDPSLGETKKTGDDKGGKGGGEPKLPGESPGRGISSLQYVDLARRVVEIEAMKKANSAKNEIQITQAKIQYQSLMLQFFVQRRFEHVVMSSRFYHQIFQDGDNQLHIDKNSEVNKLFTESLGASPTVAALHEELQH